MKKIVSLSIVLCLLMALCVPVAVAENSQGIDVSQMIEFIFAEEENGCFQYQYKTDKGNYADGSITKEMTIDGITKLFCTEGEKCDLVTITPDGDVYLNGKLVKVTTELNVIEDEMVPLAHRVRYLNSPPEGTTESEYSKLIRTEEKNIEFLQNLLDITESGFIAVIVTALGFNPLGAFGISVFLDKVVNFGTTVHPNGIYALSVITYEYQRESGPGVIRYGTVSKLYTKWYASKNQQNYIEDADTVVYRSMTG